MKGNKMSKMNLEEMIVAGIALILVLAIVYFIWVGIAWVLIQAFSLEIGMWKLGLGLFAISVMLKMMLPGNG
jgi:membrane protein implicated in regulation of membrane protease activity